MDTQVEDILDRILQEKIVFFIDYFVGKTACLHRKRTI